MGITEAAQNAANRQVELAVNAQENFSQRSAEEMGFRAFALNVVSKGVLGLRMGIATRAQELLTPEDQIDDLFKKREVGKLGIGVDQ